MNVCDFAPDSDLSKEGEGFVFGVRGMEGGDGCMDGDGCCGVRTGCHRGGVGGALG